MYFVDDFVVRIWRTSECCLQLLPFSFGGTAWIVAGRNQDTVAVAFPPLPAMTSETSRHSAVEAAVGTVRLGFVTHLIHLTGRDFAGQTQSEPIAAQVALSVLPANCVVFSAGCLPF